MATGIGFEFSVAAWAGMSALLLVAAPIVVRVSAPLIEPIAVDMAVHPARVARWMLLGPVGAALVTVMLVATIVGAPLAIIFLFAAVLAGGAGYVALCLVAGHQLMRMSGHQLPDWQSVIVGVLIARLVRLLPLVGGPLHGIIVWAGFAAAAALSWDAALSWHRRRLPDRMQFPDEEIIEWHPPEQPGANGQ